MGSPDGVRITIEDSITRLAELPGIGLGPRTTLRCARCEARRLPKEDIAVRNNLGSRRGSGSVVPTPAASRATR